VSKKCLLIGTAGDGEVLRLTPPLIIEKDHIDEAVMVLDKALKEAVS